MAAQDREHWHAGLHGLLRAQTTQLLSPNDRPSVSEACLRTDSAIISTISTRFLVQLLASAFDGLVRFILTVFCHSSFRLLTAMTDPHQKVQEASTCDT